MPRWEGTPEERFWQRVTRSEGCWLWQGKPNVGSGGYGMFTYRGKQHLAHRVSWALTHGGELPALHVLHTCDVPLCVRPDHLFLGTQAENMADMARKGRHARLRTRTKLTLEQAREIRNARTTHYARELAEQFGVSIQTIYGVWEGRVWVDAAA
jgi:hypothetical protein